MNRDLDDQDLQPFRELCGQYQKILVPYVKAKFSEIYGE